MNGDLGIHACEREDELLDALGRGYVDPDLSAHIATCVACGELQLVAGALLEERTDAIAHAPVPAGGTRWWRMQIRRRHDAQAVARWSLLIGQAITLVIAIALLVSFAGAEVVAGVRQLAASVDLSTPILLAIAASLLALPIGGWMALRQK